MARDPPPALHPHDRALLKPLSALGKPSSSTSGVAFLRRTEYIAGSQSGVIRFESTTSKDLVRLKNDPKRRKQTNVNKEDPVNIIRNISKGFDLVYPDDAYKGPDTTENARAAPSTDAERKAWSNPKHPKDSSLKLLDSYPVLPDFNSLPAMGAYYSITFRADPSADTAGYDPRLDVAMLRPLDADMAAHEDRMEAYAADPTLPKPLPEYNFDYYLCSSADSVRGIKRKFDPNDASADSDELYDYEDSDGRRGFKYRHVRTYETERQNGNDENPFEDSVALTLHDPDPAAGKKRLEKGAYFYPVQQKTFLRPKRRGGPSQRQEETEHVDALHVTVREADRSDEARRLIARAKWDEAVAESAKEAQRELEGETGVAEDKPGDE